MSEVKDPRLNEAAIILSRTTPYTAAEISAGMAELGKIPAGLETKNILELMPVILQMGVAETLDFESLKRFLTDRHQATGM